MVLSSIDLTSESDFKLSMIILRSRKLYTLNIAVFKRDNPGFNFE
jgi:hypothetical protein